MVAATIKQKIFVLAFIAAVAPAALRAQEIDRSAALHDAESFMYQLTGLDDPAALDALAATEYPLLVIDPVFTEKGQKDFDAAGMLARLRTTPLGRRRLLIAYIDVGQAEDYRSYWRKSWEPPSDGGPGVPGFIAAVDPDGWSGDYPVLYWDKRWQQIWIGKNGIVARLARLGFDGVYLDWIGGYEFGPVTRQAKKLGKNPAKEMVRFISRLRARARKITPDFLVIGQNAPYLIDDAPEYANAVDGVAFEDTWFRGEGEAAWDAPQGGDIPTDGAALIPQYRKYLNAGKAVLTVDYCLIPENAAFVYQHARAEGFIPLVTRIALSGVTETPGTE